ncbi:MAG TPA: CCA tRNA nucleotidyltransferase [Candidatus Ventrimonas merdavium]|nr:CCA tRNA nucleotidyltransferase [Candidatus Ventrimonas merdavium]
MQIQIPPQVEHIIGILNQAGFEACAVGGCVRDTLLGREPEDWDITTSARPEQVKALFRRTIDTGIQHGTVTVMVEKTGYEVTTYRIDGAYEDGRHPKQVEFTPDLLEDLKRRDFTINAMAYSRETGLVDAFGGIQDLERRVIRCVGDPMERFTEDALRILRAIRFSAQLDFSVEKETWNAISRIAPNLAKVSRERVQMELTKLLCSDHPERICQVYETGVSQYVSPAFAGLPWQKVCIPSSLSREKYVRWAAFLRCGKAPGDGAAAQTAVQILKDLKLDNATISRVRTLVAWSGAAMPADAAAVRRAMSQMEPEVWDALMELNGYGAEIRRLTDQIREAGDCLDLKHLAVKGQDLMAAGVKPGKEMGGLLDQMLEVVLDHPEENQKELLLKKFGLWPGTGNGHKSP